MLMQHTLVKTGSENYLPKQKKIAFCKLIRKRYFKRRSRERKNKIMKKIQHFSKKQVWSFYFHRDVIKASWTAVL
jgi:hypothetical protein